MGFEPTIRVTSYDDLANRSFQPAHAPLQQLRLSNAYKRIYLVFQFNMRRKKRTPYFTRNCDFCGEELKTNEPNSDGYVITSEYKIFCRIQSVGKPAIKDCHEDYINHKRINNVRKKEEKQKRLEEVQKIKKSKKVLDGFDNYLAELKQKSRRLKNAKQA